MESQRSTRAQSRVPLGNVTCQVANTDRQSLVIANAKAGDKVLVSALKQSQANVGVKKQVQFRKGVITTCTDGPRFCVCSPKKTPLVACEQCCDWHSTSCCNVSCEKTENVAEIKAVCLPCRQLQILEKLCEKLKKARPPPQVQVQAVCAKFKIPLPLNPTEDDTLVHLAVFLLKAPEVSSSLTSQETTLEKVRVQLETCGVKRGKQGQVELLNDLTFPTLRQACKLFGLDATSSKQEVVSRLHMFITGAIAPIEPQEPIPRKRAKARVQESDEDASKPDKRLAAKRRRMLQTFEIKELRQECKSRGLSVAGSHKDVVKRLVEYLENQGGGRQHNEDCSCDICDLDNAMIVHSIEVPEELV